MFTLFSVHRQREIAARPIGVTKGISALKSWTGMSPGNVIWQTHFFKQSKEQKSNTHKIKIV